MGKKKRQKKIGIHKKNLGIHDGIVKTLEQRLNDSNIPWHIQTHVEYGRKSRVIGELDIFGEAYINGKCYLLDIEVKSRDNYKPRHKAYSQLKRFHNLYDHKYDRTFYIYAYKEKGKICVERMYMQ